MINAGQQKSKNNITHSGPQVANQKIRKVGQLRRATMHASFLMEGLVLAPTLRELLEASLALQTTNTKILASHLRRSPSTIRTEFRQILSILGG